MTDADIAHCFGWEEATLTLKDAQMALRFGWPVMYNGQFYSRIHEIVIGVCDNKLHYSVDLLDPSGHSVIRVQMAEVRIVAM